MYELKQKKKKQNCDYNCPKQNLYVFSIFLTLLKWTNNSMSDTIGERPEFIQKKEEWLLSMHRSVMTVKLPCAQT